MAEKLALTDRKIKSLRGGAITYDVWDAVVPGLAVRVSPKGKRTFVLVGRFGGATNPTRRSLGVYGKTTLEQARMKAREWLVLTDKGIDPALEIERCRREEMRKQQTTFGFVAEEFIKRHVAKWRTAKSSEKTIRRELISKWDAVPITEIDRGDVIRLVEAIADRAPYMAHLTLGHMTVLFNWAIARGTYGLETSPCDRLRPSVIIGAKDPRQRILSDEEISALWRVTGKLGYPFGPLYRLILLTGCRRNEIGSAVWPEVDLTRRLLTVPRERFKSDAQHLVPLSSDACTILEELPRFFGGDFIFSYNGGRSPVSAFSDTKEEVDTLMRAELGRETLGWRLHDLRRTLRTRLSDLRVPDRVAEMVIGHGAKGLQRVYDQHSYETEMREALELWAAKLRSIVTPPPENVLEFPTRVPA